MKVKMESKNKKKWNMITEVSSYDELIKIRQINPDVDYKIIICEDKIELNKKTLNELIYLQDLVNEAIEIKNDNRWLEEIKQSEEKEKKSAGEEAELSRRDPKKAEAVIAIGIDGHAIIMAWIRKQDWADYALEQYNSLGEETFEEAPGLYKAEFYYTACSGSYCGGYPCPGDCWEEEWALLEPVCELAEVLRSYQSNKEV
jgi:hypothetical protein